MDAQQLAAERSDETLASASVIHLRYNLILSIVSAFSNIFKVIAVDGEKTYIILAAMSLSKLTTREKLVMTCLIRETRLIRLFFKFWKGQVPPPDLTTPWHFVPRLWVFGLQFHSWAPTYFFCNSTIDHQVQRK